jgi:hypothetical protein
MQKQIKNQIAKWTSTPQKDQHFKTNNYYEQMNQANQSRVDTLVIVDLLIMI